MTALAPPLVPDFVAKWRASTATERAAAQEHFIDLCHLLGHPTPNTDPTGEWYAFEKGVSKVGGGEGFADVWKRGAFGWEYAGGSQAPGCIGGPEIVSPEREVCPSAQTGRPCGCAASRQGGTA